MSKATYLDPTDYLAADAGAKPGFVSTVLGWLSAHDAKAVDGEIAAFIVARGGEITDDLEREISRRFGGMAGTPRY